jgi:hypothetical protein
MALRALWPAIRAGLIALAIAFGLVDGCPVPTRKEAPEWAHGLADRAHEARRTLRRPVAWIGEELDVSQRWALFRGASRRRFRLYLEGKPETGDWQLLHRAGDGDHAAYEDLLAYRRVRGAYNPYGQRTRGQYRPFARWMLLRVLGDHPDFVMARLRMERIEIGEGGFTPTGQFTFEHQEHRGSR